MQGLVVHPSDHQHLARALLLDDGGHHPWLSRFRRGRHLRIEPLRLGDSEGVSCTPPLCLAVSGRGLQWSLVTLAKNERAALCDLPDKVGPEAPTLCEGWTTHDLAAHLWIRETDPLGAGGIVAKPLAGCSNVGWPTSARWEFTETGSTGSGTARLGSRCSPSLGVDEPARHRVLDPPRGRTRRASIRRPTGPRTGDRGLHLAPAQAAGAGVLPGARSVSCSRAGAPPTRTNPTPSGGERDADRGRSSVSPANCCCWTGPD